MKFGFIFIVFMFGTFICATHPAPTTSDIQHAATNKELLLNKISKSEQKNAEESGFNNEAAESKWKKSYRDFMQGFNDELTRHRFIMTKKEKNSRSRAKNLGQLAGYFYKKSMHAGF